MNSKLSPNSTLCIPYIKLLNQVISSMTDAFCGGCNRLRITANGAGLSCKFLKGPGGFRLRDLRVSQDQGTLLAGACNKEGA